jgi:hypothetical protein
MQIHLYAMGTHLSAIATNTHVSSNEPSDISNVILAQAFGQYAIGFFVFLLESSLSLWQTLELSSLRVDGAQGEEDREDREPTAATGGEGGSSRRA